MQQIIKKEWNGFAIEFEDVNGQLMANATSMCAAFGKKPAKWMELDSTQRYIKALEEKHVSDFRTHETRNGSSHNGGGTWIHEKLILKLAQWLSVDFEIQCDEWVAELLCTGKVELAPATPALPTDYEEALTALLAEVKENKAKDLVIASQQQQLTQAAPALAAHAALIASPGNILVNVAAKNMNLKDMGGKQLFVYLRANNIISSQPNNYNLPHQQYLTSGYFVVKSRAVNKPGFSSVTHTPYVTPAGLVYLYQRLVKAGYQAQTIKTLAQAAKTINNVTSAIKQLGGSITVNTNFLPL